MLLSRLAIDLGYTEIDENTFFEVPFTIMDYTDVILKTEGLLSGVGGDSMREVRSVVTEVFDLYSDF